MGTVGTAPGGGKVTVTGLSAAVIKKGASVTVRQGSKTVQSVSGQWVGDATDVFVNCQNCGSAGWWMQQGAHCGTRSQPHNVEPCVWTATAPFTAKLHVVRNPVTDMTPEYSDGQVVTFRTGDTITFHIHESRLNTEKQQINYVLFYPV